MGYRQPGHGHMPVLVCNVMAQTHRVDGWWEGHPERLMHVWFRGSSGMMYSVDDHHLAFRLQHAYVLGHNQRCMWIVASDHDSPDSSPAQHVAECVRCGAKKGMLA